jgi:hypothetical protein
MDVLTGITPAKGPPREDHRRQETHHGAQNGKISHDRPRRQKDRPNPGTAEAAQRAYSPGTDESDWLAAHSVRRFLSGTVGMKMGLAGTSAKGEDGERNYSVKG